jgi:hypothetical protein
MTRLGTALLLFGNCDLAGNLWWLTLRDTNSNLELADIEDTNTCPECNPDTDIGTAHSTRESQARGGIDSESCDREAQSSQQGYDAEEF